MRCAAKRSNGTPRAAPYRRAASTRPSASTSEFVTVDVTGKLHGHLKDDVFHEVKVLLDQRRQLDIHRAHRLAGLRPRSAGSDASSPLFVVALVHRPRDLSVAIPRGFGRVDDNLERFCEISSTSLAPTPCVGVSARLTIDLAGSSDEGRDALEANRLHTPVGERGEQTHGVGMASKTSSTGHQIVRKDMHRRGGSHRTSNHGRPFDRSVPSRGALDPNPPTQLNADGADAAFGVWGPQHRERCETVSSRGCLASGDAGPRRTLVPTIGRQGAQPGSNLDHRPDPETRRVPSRPAGRRIHRPSRQSIPVNSRPDDAVGRRPPPVPTLATWISSTSSNSRAP